METINNAWKNNKLYIALGCLILVFLFTKFYKQPISRAMGHFSLDQNHIIAEKHAQGIVFPGHNSTVAAIAFSPDGSKMVSGSADSETNLILWDISDLQDIKPIQLIGHPDMVNDVAFSPDGSKIISGSRGKRKNLILWDISDLNNIKRTDFNDPNEGVWAVAFSPDGSKIVSGSFKESEQSNCILWDVETGKKIANLDGQQSFVSSLAFSLHDNKIVTGDWWGRENNLILWDVNDINDIQEHLLLGHPGQISGVAFSPDGTKIVSAGKGEQNNLIVWDVSDINKVKSFVLSNEYADVRCVACSPDGSIIAEGNATEESTENHNNITLWNAMTNKKITTLDSQQNGIWSVAFSPDGKYLASGGWRGDNTLILWTLMFE